MCYGYSALLITVALGMVRRFFVCAHGPRLQLEGGVRAILCNRGGESGHKW